jgi:hypothetical protein
MRKHLLFILLLSFFLAAFAQKEKKATGKYQINLSKSEYSENQACEACKELARIEAIEKVFGTVMIQGNTTTIRNTRTGKEVQTDQIFNMIAETYVNGDWIETIDESCDRFIYEDDFWIKCEVKGVVKELTEAKVDIAVKPLDCEQASCVTAEFQEGEDFFVYLKSAAPGYVSVYLSDGNIAQRIFPYREMPEDQLNGVKIKADQEYILFSKDQDQLDLRSYVDEYELYAENDVDQNRIYVIYSEKPLVKPSLNKGNSHVAGIDMPMELDFQDFQRWLAENRRYHDGIQVERVDITVTK